MADSTSKASTTTIVLGVSTAVLGIGCIILGYKYWVANVTLETIYQANPSLKPLAEPAKAA